MCTAQIHRCHSPVDGLRLLVTVFAASCLHEACSVTGDLERYFVLFERPRPAADQKVHARDQFGSLQYPSPERFRRRSPVLMRFSGRCTELPHGRFEAPPKQGIGTALDMINRSGATATQTEERRRWRPPSSPLIRDEWNVNCTTRGGAGRFARCNTIWFDEPLAKLLRHQQYCGNFDPDYRL